MLARSYKDGFLAVRKIGTNGYTEAYPYTNHLMAVMVVPRSGSE